MKTLFCLVLVGFVWCARTGTAQTANNPEPPTPFAVDCNGYDMFMGLLELLPNPASWLRAIPVYLEEGGDVRLLLADANGVIDVIHAGRLPAGRTTISYDAPLQSGTYRCLMEYNGKQVQVQKVVVQ